MIEVNSFLNKNKNESNDKLDFEGDIVEVDEMFLNFIDKFLMEIEVFVIFVLFNFFFGLFNNVNKYKYFEYVFKFKVVDFKILYKELYDRIFLFKYLIKFFDGGYLSDGIGIVWLFDYYKYINLDNKYKLFLVINLYVLVRFSNLLEKE